MLPTSFARDHTEEPAQAGAREPVPGQRGTVSDQDITRLVAAEVRRAVRTNGSVALMLIDLELVAERVSGAPALDRPLIELVVQSLQHNIREYDVAAPYDAATLAVLLPESDPVTAEGVAERLLQITEHVARELLPERSAEIGYRAHAGLASFPHNAADDETLFIKAHEALETAIATGCRIVRLPNRVAVPETTVDRGWEVDEAWATAMSGIQARERERARIARELHDGPIQTLAHVLSVTELVSRTMRSNEPFAERLLADLRRHVSETLDEVRRISRNLHPALLDHLGLVSAVRRLTADMSDDEGPQIDLAVRGREQRLPPLIELAAFRIIQEALSNCRRHAQAKRVQVELCLGADQLVVRVSDDGRGLAVPDLKRLAAAGHHGLLSMRERCKYLGGAFEFRSAPDRGTTILARLPLQRHADG